MLRSVKHSILPLSAASGPQLVFPACLHTSSVSSSRIKKVQRHKPLWHIKKLNKAEDAPLTVENRDFIKEVISDQYSGGQDLSKIYRKYLNSIFIFRSIEI